MSKYYIQFFVQVLKANLFFIRAQNHESFHHWKYLQELKFHLRTKISIEHLSRFQRIQIL